jgi:DNA polymerase-3 subunit epsilon/exodeoxyribonuclease X
MAKYIILDTETTGTEENDRIIQLGYVVLGDKVSEVHNEFCSCDTPISWGAMETHGITPEMIEGKPACVDTDAYKRLLELNTEDNVVIIHNAPFDIWMLEKEGFSLNMKLIDTLRCAKHLYPDEEAHRLQYFRYRMELYKDEEEEATKLGVEVKAHDAIGDVLILKLFLTELKKTIKDKFPDENIIDKMVSLTKEPILIKEFKFGKYKGQLLKDVATKDAGYLKWLLTSMENLDSDLRYSIEKVLEQ